MLKGLDLAKQYYEQFGKDAIEQFLASHPQISIAAGLAGEGSQCFGYDDQLSRDHDFAPGFCIWLSDEDFSSAGAELQAAYDRLPDRFLDISRENMIAKGRLGVTTISRFYSQFTGCSGTVSQPGLPQNNLQWLMAPEHCLAAATNGRIFRDDSGVFSRVRQSLLDFYPPDVLRKKIAARAAVLSQAGQYNLLRVIRREDEVAAMLSASRFTEAALSMIYLLNRRYMPFYKWAYHGLSDLELLSDIGRKLEKFPEVFSRLQSGKAKYAYDQAFSITEEICAALAAELRRQGFSSVQSDFLQDHLADIMAGIADPQIGNMPPMADFN